MTAINEIRRRHPALHRLRTIEFHPSNNPQVIAYSKQSDDGDDAVLMVVSLDPNGIQEAILDLDLDALGLPADEPYAVVDELSGERYTWTGRYPYVRLAPDERVAHILDLHPDGRGAEPGRGQVAGGG
jgi:starch synthase (maltosyl-transferring)